MIDLCEKCKTEIPTFEQRQDHNIPYVWWADEVKKFTCSYPCYQRAYLGMILPEKVEKKKGCPDCRAVRGRCSAHGG